MDESIYGVGMMKHTIIIAALLTATSGASAQEANFVTVTGLSGWSENATTHVAAIKITLAPDWKTYWRSPGANGIPPQFEWDTGTNVTSVSMDWPQPKVFHSGGAQSIGYSDEVILPLIVTKGKGTATLSGTLRFGVCQDICVPVDMAVNIPLTDTGPQADIIAALESGPEERRSNATCTMAPITGGFEVTMSARFPEQGAHEVSVMELSNPNIWVSDATTTRNGNMITSTADVISMTATPTMVGRSDLRLTVFGDDNMIEMRGCTAG